MQKNSGIFGLMAVAAILTTGIVFSDRAKENRLQHRPLAAGAADPLVGEPQWFDATPPVDDDHDESRWTTNTETVCLAVVILLEAGGESMEGQVAVGDVVMNRLQASKEPDVTVCRIAEEPGQFAYPGARWPAKIDWTAPPFRTAMFVADAVLRNRQATPSELARPDATGGATCFNSLPGAKGVRIGGHTFTHCQKENP